MDIISNIERLLKIVLGESELPELQLSTNFEEHIGMDEVDIMTLELYLEDEYGVPFPEFDPMSTLGEMVSYIERNLSSPSSVMSR